MLEEHKPRLEGIGLLENFSRLVIIVTGLIVIAIISVLIYPLPFQPPPYTLVIRNLRPAVLVALFFFIALFFQDLLSKRKKLVAPPKVNFPSRLYEGDSCMTEVHLTGWSDLAPRGERVRALFFIDEYGNKQPLGMDIETDFNPKYLAIELLAAGFDIEGAKKQKQEISFAPMNYRWNIRPLNSGNYEVGLIFRTENASGRTRELGVVTHNVSVVKIDHLTSRHLWVLTRIFGLLTGTLGVLEVLNRLGIITFT